MAPMASAAVAASAITRVRRIMLCSFVVPSRRAALAEGTDAPPPRFTRRGALYPPGGAPDVRGVLRRGPAEPERLVDHRGRVRRPRRGHRLSLVAEGPLPQQ